MNVFWPFRTSESPSNTAAVRMPLKASLPAPGAVSTQAPIFSKLRTGTAQRSMASGVPRPRITAALQRRIQPLSRLSGGDLMPAAARSTSHHSSAAGFS